MSNEVMFLTGYVLANNFTVLYWMYMVDKRARMFEERLENIELKIDQEVRQRRMKDLMGVE